MYSRRWVTEDDFVMLNKWWKENRFKAPSPSMLPQNGSGGIIVERFLTPICAGFLYTTNSPIAIVEYVVADFQEKDREIRNEALKFLISELGNIAKVNGYKVVFTSLKNQNLMKSFFDSGYKVGDIKTTQLVKII